MATRPASRSRASEPVRFVLDGEVIELDDVDPTRTVLEFLREDLRRTGTKEGCAEGDCGACTTVIADLDDDGSGLRVRAINACIRFLPTLDGKELITVESLTKDRRDLHPVQRAMVDCHGSQCGFCTPGFVMSLFALYKTEVRPGRRAIDDALAGNLCRCTGYRPIIEAARRMYDHGDDTDWLRQPAGREQVPAERIERLRSIRAGSATETGANGRCFHAPATVAELAESLAGSPDATILAGGTDVGLWVTKRHDVLDTVVWTGNIAELHRVDVGEDAIRIGAAATLTDAMPALLGDYPELTELMLRFASPPIRNAATLGGNIANGSPIGDSMPALMVLGTTLGLRSAHGAREIPLDEFYLDYMVNALEPGEFVETVRIPRRPNDAIVRSYKVSKRFDQDISAVCGAFALRLDGLRVATARVAYGGMAATVRRATHCEEALAANEFDEAGIARAAEALARDFEPISDMRASSRYRLRVAQNLLSRLRLEVEGELDTTVYTHGRTA